MPNRARSTIALILIAVAAAGLLLASGNLITLPSIQSQLGKVAPNAEDAIAKAVAMSRRKTYYGIGICSTILMLGMLVLPRRGKTVFARSDQSDAS